MNETMKTSIAGLKLIRSSEGLRFVSYPDPSTGADPWTIGYGHTTGVTPDLTITQQQAEDFLLEDVADCEAVILKWVQVPLTQGMWDALVSFIFNLGPGSPSVKDGFVWLMNGHHSSMLQLINLLHYTQAAEEFPKWAAHPPLPGLVTRRAVEQKLFMSQGEPR